MRNRIILAALLTLHSTRKAWQDLTTPHSLAIANITATE